MVPYVNIIGVEESDPEDVLIYGDYYLWEMAIEGDVLVAVSGGHCPGVIHAERFGEGETAIYSALRMEEALTDDEAEPLFGTYFEAYQGIASDQDTREAEMAQVFADYVRANDLAVSKYQIAEEEARELP